MAGPSVTNGITAEMEHPLSFLTVRGFLHVLLQVQFSVASGSAKVKRIMTRTIPVLGVSGVWAHTQRAVCLLRLTTRWDNDTKKLGSL